MRRPDPSLLCRLSSPYLVAAYSGLDAAPTVDRNITLQYWIGDQPRRSWLAGLPLFWLKKTLSWYNGDGDERRKKAAWAEEVPSMTEVQLQGILDEITNRITERFNPERIILFGSHASGTAGVDSDLDLLVVMPVSGSKRQAAVEIGAVLHDIPLPKDIIVSTPEDFAWRQEITGTIEYPAVHEGKVLYAKPRACTASDRGMD